jgi:hypothetical protein
MTKIHVAHLLWAIFTDAQDYFNTPHDVINNPPVSHLDWIIGGMKGGNLPTMLGTLLQAFCGSGNGTGNPYQIEKGSVGGNNEPGGPKHPRGSPAPNTMVHSRIETATAAARQCNPDVDYWMLMAIAPHPKPRITTMQLHYLFFGKCAGAHCSFKHDGEVNESKIDGVIAKCNRHSPSLSS